MYERCDRWGERLHGMPVQIAVQVVSVPSEGIHADDQFHEGYDRITGSADSVYQHGIP